MRLVHIFLGAGHLAFIYVDDLLVLIRKKNAWKTACLLAVFLSCLGVPLSWHKLCVGQRVKYLGLVLDLVEYTLGFCEDKLKSFRDFLGRLVKGVKLDKKAFQKSIGKLQWAVIVAPQLRPWMATFYTNMNAPGSCWMMDCPEVIQEKLEGLDVFVHHMFPGRHARFSPQVESDFWPPTSVQIACGWILS